MLLINELLLHKFTKYTGLECMEWPQTSFDYVRTNFINIYQCDLEV